AAVSCERAQSVTYCDAVCGDAGATAVTRSLTATCACANPTGCIQIISVEDNTAPSITCPDNVTVGCDESTDPADTGTATATDDCHAEPSGTERVEALNHAIEATVTSTLTAPAVRGCNTHRT